MEEEGTQTCYTDTEGAREGPDNQHQACPTPAPVHQVKVWHE